VLRRHINSSSSSSSKLLHCQGERIQLQVKEKVLAVGKGKGNQWRLQWQKGAGPASIAPQSVQGNNISSSSVFTPATDSSASCLVTLEQNANANAVAMANERDR